jgi:hypothetical protein
MQVVTIKPAKILKPNKDHKNFVETGEIIPVDTALEGNERYISGLRRGEAFTYKVFITKDNQIIYLNNIKPMSNVEVSLGADGVTSTKMESKSLKLSNINLIGIAIGGLSGYMYSKSKNCSTTNMIIYSVVGAGIGFGVTKIIKK